MAGKEFSVFVNIGGRMAPSFTSAVSGVEGRLKRLSAHFKQAAREQREIASQMSASFKGAAAMAASAGIVFSVKHAIEGGEELAHEMQGLRNMGVNAADVGKGLREANEAIREMPTANLTNGIKILKETTGAYGDYHHAVENLKFNSKLGDVLKNTIGVEDPAHALASLVKALEIRGSAGNAKRYQEEAGKLQQAMTFFGGRLTPDEIYTFTRRAQVGSQQLGEHFMTRIAPSMIQEYGGEGTGTGLTAFRSIISGRKISDMAQAKAWQKLGLLNEKDIITNKKTGEIKGWKDGAIKGTRLAYQDPLEFMEKVILPRLQASGVDITDDIKLGSALNTLFKNTKANAFTTAIGTVTNRARLHKDENLMNGVLSTDQNYDESLLNDPKFAGFAIKQAMNNIGSALTLPLMKPMAQMLISVARGINQVSAALIAHPEAARIVAGLGAAFATFAALRIANLVFGITAFARSLALLSVAAPLGLAGRIVGISRGLMALNASTAANLELGLLGAGRGLLSVARGMAAAGLASTLSIASRIRSIAAAMLMLNAVGGGAAIRGTIAGSLSRLGLAVLSFPLVMARGVAGGLRAMALATLAGSRAALTGLAVGLGRLALNIVAFPLTMLRATAMGIAGAFRLIGAGMFALVASPVGLTIAAVVTALAALGVWVANNWAGIKTFFGAFGSAFMGALGPGASGAVSSLIGYVRQAWTWINNLLGPLDASGKKWAEWGTWAGQGAASIVTALSNLPAEVGRLAKEAWDALVNFDWAAAGLAIVGKIGSGLAGLGGLVLGKMNPFAAGTPVAPSPGAPAPVPGVVTKTPSMLRATPLAGARALGGPVAKGLPYLIGEKGPEIFVPDTDGTVKTNSQLNAFRAGRNNDGARVSPVVETASIEAATEKAEKLRAVLGAIGKSDITLGEPGAVGGDEGGGSGGSGGGGGGAPSLGGAAAGAGGSGRRGFMSHGGVFGGPLNLAGGDATGAEADGIRESAKKYGVDPRVAVAVAKSEGLGTAWGSGMDHGTSFGAFQLHVGGGLGDIYQKETGHDPRDQRNSREMNDWAIKYASTHGWGPWHGAARIGVHGMAGIGGRPATGDLRGADAVGSTPDVGIAGPASRIGLGIRTLSRECVALAKAAVGANGSVTTWRRGINAAEGTLKPGAPIATFLDRFGRTSERYAGGGTGTRGANRDHAGIFQEYLRDKGGKIIGMRMAEQYARIGRPVSKAYYFGKGAGEGNASNYHAVMDERGGYLGGKRNPMARAAEKPAAVATASKPPVAAHRDAVARLLHPHHARAATAGAGNPDGSTKVALAGARALGGAVGGGLSYLVGERGPEIFTPGAAGHIDTNKTLARLTDIGRMAVEGTGGASFVPEPKQMASMMAAPGGASPGSKKGGERGNFHAGNHTWNIYGAHDPQSVQRQVESHFSAMLRDLESDQRGSLSD